MRGPGRRQCPLLDISGWDGAPHLANPRPDPATAAAVELRKAWLRGSRVLHQTRSRASGQARPRGDSAAGPRWRTSGGRTDSGVRQRASLRLRRGVAFPQAGVSPRWGPQVHEASWNLGLAAGAARRFRGNRTVLQTPLTGPCGHVHERRGWASRRLEAQPSCSLPTPRNDGHRPVEFTKGTNHRESLCAGCVAPPQSDHHGRQVTPMPGGGGGMGHAGQRDGPHTRIRFHCTPGEPRQ